jgi:hypothetical protein
MEKIVYSATIPSRQPHEPAHSLVIVDKGYSFQIRVDGIEAKVAYKLDDAIANGAEHIKFLDHIEGRAGVFYAYGTDGSGCIGQFSTKRAAYECVRRHDQRPNPTLPNL